jgi:hypothetical protein
LQDRLASPAKVTRRQEELHDLRVGLKEWRRHCTCCRADADFPQTETTNGSSPFAAAGDMRFWQCSAVLSIARNRWRLLSASSTGRMFAAGWAEARKGFWRRPRLPIARSVSWKQ